MTYLEAAEIAPAFNEFICDAFEDRDFERLFWARDLSTENQLLSEATAIEQIASWFEPFHEARLHPYLTGN